MAHPKNKKNSASQSVFSSPVRRGLLTAVAIASRGRDGDTGSAQPILIAVVSGLLTLFIFDSCSRNTAATPPKLSSAQIQTISEKAARGDAEAQTTLGAAYSRGDGVKQDYNEAAGWYRKAAAQNNPKAQCALGELFEAGQGVPHDQQQAADWYHKAAEQGLAAAQYNLAALYAVGKGVPFNNAEALKWYLQAANQGDPLAQYNVGMRYAEGHGIKPDPVIAYKWLSLAAGQGLPDAAGALKPLKDRMSGAQLSQARELVQQFKLAKASKP